MRTVRPGCIDMAPPDGGVRIVDGQPDFIGASLQFNRTYALSRYRSERDRLRLGQNPTRFLVTTARCSRPTSSAWMAASSWPFRPLAIPHTRSGATRHSLIPRKLRRRSLLSSTRSRTAPSRLPRACRPRSRSPSSAMCRSATLTSLRVPRLHHAFGGGSGTEPARTRAGARRSERGGELHRWPLRHLRQHQRLHWHRLPQWPPYGVLRGRCEFLRRRHVRVCRPSLFPDFGIGIAGPDASLETGISRGQVAGGPRTPTRTWHRQRRRSPRASNRRLAPLYIHRPPPRPRSEHSTRRHGWRASRAGDRPRRPNH